MTRLHRVRVFRQAAGYCAALLSSCALVAGLSLVSAGHRSAHARPSQSQPLRLALSPSRHWVPRRYDNPGIGRYPDIFNYFDFADARHGWWARWGEKPYQLMRTADGGRTWVEQAPYAGPVEFISPQVGWVLGVPYPDETKPPPKLRIGITTNGGKSWAWRVASDELRADAIAPVSGMECWAISVSPAKLTHTIDGGRTWQQVRYRRSADPKALLAALAFFDQQHGWLLEQNGHGMTVFRTADGGRTFAFTNVPQVTPGGGLPYRFAFSTAQDGWLAVGGGSLLHTSDGGRKWVAVAPAVKGWSRLRLVDCSFPTRQVGWAVGSVGDRKGAVAICTRDGGRTWRQDETGAEPITYGWFYRVVFVDENHGWAAGEGGQYETDTPQLKEEHEVSFLLRYLASPMSPRE